MFPYRSTDINLPRISLGERKITKGEEGETHTFPLLLKGKSYREWDPLPAGRNPDGTSHRAGTRCGPRVGKLPLTEFPALRERDEFYPGRRSRVAALLRHRHLQTIRAGGWRSPRIPARKRGVPGGEANDAISRVDPTPARGNDDKSCGTRRIRITILILYR